MKYATKACLAKMGVMGFATFAIFRRFGKRYTKQDNITIALYVAVNYQLQYRTVLNQLQVAIKEIDKLKDKEAIS